MVSSLENPFLHKPSPYLLRSAIGTALSGTARLDMEPTVGASFMTAKYTAKFYENLEEQKTDMFLEIWDSAGQKRFRTV